MANLVFLIVVAAGGLVAGHIGRNYGWGEESSPAVVMFFALLIGATLRAIINRFQRDR